MEQPATLAHADNPNTKEVEIVELQFQGLCQKAKQKAVSVGHR